tara:strand:- start:411 stop:617 length:207 start_codon:yes stop_codon:yes gene_type:complete
MIAKRIISREYIKDIPNWEKEYLTMNVNLSKREKELLEGSPIKSDEGMMYGRMYADWKEKRIKQTLNA